MEIKHELNVSEYIRLTCETSEMSKCSKIAGIWPKIIIVQAQMLI